MIITSKFTMDLQNPGVMPIVHGVQDDRNSRELEITLTAAGRCWPIPEDAAVLIRFRKADGKGGEYDTLPDGTPAWQAEHNVLRIALAPQVLTMPGNVSLTVTLLQGDSRLSTFGVQLRVEAASKALKLDSEDYSSITGFLRIPEKALPGQLLQVAAVDEKGRVTELEAVPNLPGDWDRLFTTEELKIPAYTNQVPLSVDENGQVCGFIPNSALGDDGSAGYSAYHGVSGFIPVKKGDIIRVRDPGVTELHTDVVFALYPADKSLTTGIGKYVGSAFQSNPLFGSFVVEGNTAVWDTSGIGYWLWGNFAWLRVTTVSPDTIVTVNEELVEHTAQQYVLRPEVKVREDNLDFAHSAKTMADKTIVGFGDSIFGMVRDDTSVLSIVEKETGAAVHNVGFGGCRMSRHPVAEYAPFSMWALAKAIAENDWSEQEAQAANGSDYFPEQLETLKNLDFGGVDMAIIHYGINDFTGDAPTDNAENPTDCATLCGALRYSIETLLGAFPKLQIVLSLPAYRWWPDTGAYPENYVNSLGLGLEEYVLALRGVAEEYHLPVIDCYGAPGINKWNVAALTMDGTHHNAAGRKRLGEYIAAHLMG